MLLLLTNVCAKEVCAAPWMAVSWSGIQMIQMFVQALMQPTVKLSVKTVVLTSNTVLLGFVKQCKLEPMCLLDAVAHWNASD